MSDIRKYIELIESSLNTKSGNAILTSFIKKNVKNEGLRLSFDYHAKNIMTATLVFAIEEPKNVEIVKSLCEIIKDNGSYDEVEYDQNRNTFAITVVHDEVSDDLEDIII